MTHSWTWRTALETKEGLILLTAKQRKLSFFNRGVSPSLMASRSDPTTSGLEPGEILISGTM